MANKGQLGNGKSLISEETCNEFHSDPKIMEMKVPSGRFAFTKGGVNLWGNDYLKTQQPDVPISGLAEIYGNRDRDGYYGWIGWGGTVFQWNPDLKISFAYVPNDIIYHVVYNYRGAKL